MVATYFPAIEVPHVPPRMFSKTMQADRVERTAHGLAIRARVLHLWKVPGCRSRQNAHTRSITLILLASLLCGSVRLSPSPRSQRFAYRRGDGYDHSLRL